MIDGQSNYQLEELQHDVVNLTPDVNDWIAQILRAALEDAALLLRTWPPIKCS